jgi:hypothetical protein
MVDKAAKGSAGSPYCRSTRSHVVDGCTSTLIMDVHVEPPATDLDRPFTGRACSPRFPSAVLSISREGQDRNQTDANGDETESGGDQHDQPYQGSHYQPCSNHNPAHSRVLSLARAHTAVCSAAQYLDCMQETRRAQDILRQVEQPLFFPRTQRNSLGKCTYA